MCDSTAVYRHKFLARAGWKLAACLGAMLHRMQCLNSGSLGLVSGLCGLPARLASSAARMAAEPSLLAVKRRRLSLLRSGSSTGDSSPVVEGPLRQQKRRLPPPPAAAAQPPYGPAKRAAKQQLRPKPDPHADAPWLIVGLGNPGSNYAKTRHNVGFMVVDALARSAGIDMRKLHMSAAVGTGSLHGQQVIIAKPVTFMNNSGEAVAALARFYKVPRARLLVVSDDLDQPLAALRLRAGGGHGGHNGLRSIATHLGGASDFPRLKIGIGRPPGQQDVASWVLSEFRRGEQEALDGAVAQALVVIHSCLALGLDKALSGSRL